MLVFVEYAAESVSSADVSWSSPPDQIGVRAGRCACGQVRAGLGGARGSDGREPQYGTSSPKSGEILTSGWLCSGCLRDGDAKT
jgi:hypothetical protein